MEKTSSTRGSRGRGRTTPGPAGPSGGNSKGSSGKRGRGGQDRSAPSSSASPSASSPAQPRLVLDVREFDDYRAVAERLREHQRHAGGRGQDDADEEVSDAFGVLIGCSGHSPVPTHLVDKVAAALHRRAIRRHRLKVVWGGGDPCFRFRNRGGNVADVARALLRIHAAAAAAAAAAAEDDDADADAVEKVEGELLVAAVQREDHAGKVPAFERVVVSYRAALAEVGGRVTFGGFETEAPPAYRAFLDALRREAAAGDATHDADDDENKNKKRKLKEPTTKEKEMKEMKEKRRIGGAFLPPDGVFPMAASAGYLSLLPALLDARTPLPAEECLGVTSQEAIMMSWELVLMVIPTAGMITLQEVNYTKLLIEHLAKQRREGTVPVHVYVPTWDNMEAHLQPAEKNGKCKLAAIMAVLRGLEARFPANVHFIDV